MIEQNLLEAFRIMWGLFPEPVLLVHKNRTILAVNDLARSAGITEGIKCHSLSSDRGPDSTCSRCQANRALRSGETAVLPETMGTAQILSYWVPLKDNPDVYIHFGIGSVEAAAAGTCGS